MHRLPASGLGVHSGLWFLLWLLLFGYFAGCWLLVAAWFSVFWFFCQSPVRSSIFLPILGHRALTARRGRRPSWPRGNPTPTPTPHTVHVSCSCSCAQRPSGFFWLWPFISRACSRCAAVCVCVCSCYVLSMYYNEIPDFSNRFQFQFQRCEAGRQESSVTSPFRYLLQDRAGSR